VKFVWLLGISTLLLPALSHASLKTCDVRSYGAKGDGTSKDTKSIQMTIDDCSAAGGGALWF